MRCVSKKDLYKGARVHTHTQTHTQRDTHTSTIIYIQPVYDLTPITTNRSMKIVERCANTQSLAAASLHSHDKPNRWAH